MVNSSLQRYWNAVRSRWWLVIVTAVLAGGVAMLYVAHATKLYTAEADLLVSPVRSSDTALLGLGLINSSVDPTRAAQTVSSLVRSYDVAGEAQRTLRTAHGPRSLLSEVTVSPSGQSNVVAVKATTSDPTFSRRLADAFAQAAITLRTEHIHSVVKQLLPSLIAGSHGLTPDNPLVTEVAQLQELLVAPDPTLQLISHAQQPTSPSSPRPLLSLIVAVIGGAVLGVVGAFVLHMADPRLRRLSTLRENYRLPVLAHIKPGRGEGALDGADAGGEAREGIRGLAARLALDDELRSVRALAISGVSGGEGASAAAIDLARALANAGQTVLLIDAELNAPSVGPLLEIVPERGLQEVIAGDVPLLDAIVPWLPGAYLLLPSAVGDAHMRDVFASEEVERLLEEGQEIADWVVVDIPPVNRTIDALPYARSSRMLIVVRTERTQLPDLSALASTLARHDIRPEGFIAIED